MPVRVLDVARVASPEGWLRWLDAGCACGHGTSVGRIYLRGRTHVVAERQLGRRPGALLDFGIAGQAPAGPERELEAACQVEERHGAVREFAPDDPLCRPARSEERRVGKECRSRGWR